ncbi:MAG: LPS export ABC transporter ATP-binding protein [Deltaproteobacteria bacterium]|nr:LPS export ABC transporter ATP-binding protein [Deltaproteobacteria bacterium]MBN2672664.1 LPS export ABC transporter ATP-binding protein [Deltaproteobacteria bacterium]
MSGLSKRFGGREVVRDVSITVSPNEVVGLLGPNGAGKTTTFKMILGLERQDVGSVRLGESLDGLPLYQRARKGLGYLPQTPSVFSKLTVRDNILAVLQTVKAAAPREQTDALLQRFGLTGVAEQKASTLSGGERRKLEFARSLCASPRMLLVDEPFAAVDPIAAEELVECIRQLAQEGMGVLLTDHSVRQSLSACDRVYLIVNGEIVEQGTSEEIRNSRRAQTLYLGSDV